MCLCFILPTSLAYAPPLHQRWSAWSRPGGGGVPPSVYKTQTNSETAPFSEEPFTCGIEDVWDRACAICAKTRTEWRWPYVVGSERAFLGTAGRLGSRTCGFVWDRASGARTTVQSYWVREDEDVWDRACRVGSYVLVIGSERGRSSGAVRRVRAHRWLRGACCGVERVQDG